MNNSFYSTFTYLGTITFLAVRKLDLIQTVILSLLFFILVSRTGLQILIYFGA